MSIHAQHQLNYEKIIECFETVKGLHDITVKSSMFKLYKNCKEKWTDLDNEFITCRRYLKITPKYTQIAKELDECVKVFYQWQMIAVLSQV